MDKFEALKEEHIREWKRWCWVLYSIGIVFILYASYTLIFQEMELYIQIQARALILTSTIWIIFVHFMSKDTIKAINGR